MKKNNGFTLVELLGVIVILGVIGTIATTAVTAIMNNSKDKINTQAEGNLADSASTYALDNRKTLALQKCEVGFKMTDASQFNNNCMKKVTVQTLINDGFFTNDSSSCDKNAEVIIYRYVDADAGYDEYRAFVVPGTCK